MKYPLRVCFPDYYLSEEGRLAAREELVRGSGGAGGESESRGVEGHGHQHQSGAEKNCAKHCVMNEWSAWAPAGCCTKSSGESEKNVVQKRSRTVYRYPMFGGDPCPKPLTEQQVCPPCGSAEDLHAETHAPERAKPEEPLVAPTTEANASAPANNATESARENEVDEKMNETEEAEKDLGRGGKQRQNQLHEHNETMPTSGHPAAGRDYNRSLKNMTANETRSVERSESDLSKSRSLMPGLLPLFVAIVAAVLGLAVCAAAIWCGGCRTTASSAQPEQKGPTQKTGPQQDDDDDPLLPRGREAFRLLSSSGDWGEDGSVLSVSDRKVAALLARDEELVRAAFLKAGFSPEFATAVAKKITDLEGVKDGEDVKNIL
eukprot:g12949.t1